MDRLMEKKEQSNRTKRNHEPKAVRGLSIRDLEAINTTPENLGYCNT